MKVAVMVIVVVILSMIMTKQQQRHQNKIMRVVSCHRLINHCLAFSTLSSESRSELNIIINGDVD